MTSSLKRACVALTALAVGIAWSAGADAEASGRVRVNGPTKAAIVRAFDAYTRDGNGPECYNVWLAASTARWAVLRLSPSAGRAGCRLYDGGEAMLFNSKSSKGWVLAGRGPVGSDDRCYFRIMPPWSVREDFGCWK